MVKLPINVDIHNLIDDLRVLSWEAADILIYYSKMLKDSDLRKKIISNNDTTNPVTLADLKVNEIIIQGIKENYKTINWEILSEENVKTDHYTFDRNAEWIWVLDPLDGTKDFIQGTGNYAMHLALQYQNLPVIGVVLIPEKNELWITNGANVWCERRDGSRVKKNISPKRSLKGMTLVTSKNHKNYILEELIHKISFKEVINMGSIGCKIASIMRGESDIYISLSLPGKSSPKDWDFAAPASLLKAFGGAITNINNQELSYNKANFEQRGIIVATNDKDSHKKICFELRGIIEKYDLYPFNI